MLVSGGRLPQRARAIPTGPGSTTSTGPKFHTARWEHEHDLTGKVVAVVGTGSSATQVVPAIQPIVQQLYVFQREPGWVMPKGERDFTDEERATFAQPWRRRRERWRQQVRCWRRACGAARSLPARHQDQRGPHGSSASTTSTASFARPSRPARGRHARRTRIPGKRPIFASTFYPALKKDNVELVPQGGRVGDARPGSSTPTASSARSTSS